MIFFIFRTKVSYIHHFETSSEDVFLGNQFCVDTDRYKVLIIQTAYIDELLGKFGMGDSRPV